MRTVIGMSNKRAASLGFATKESLNNNIFYSTKKYELSCVKDVKNINTVCVKFENTAFTELSSIAKIIDCKAQYQQRIIKALIKKYA